MLRVGIRVQLDDVEKGLLEIPNNFLVDVLLKPEAYMLESIPLTLELLDNIIEMGIKIISLSLMDCTLPRKIEYENLVFLAENINAEYIVLKVSDPRNIPSQFSESLIGASLRICLIPPKDVDIGVFMRCLTSLKYRQFVTIAYDIFERYTGQTKRLIEELSSIRGLLSIVYLSGMDSKGRRASLTSKSVIDLWEIISNLIVLKEDVIMIFNYPLDKASLLKDYGMVKEIYTSIMEKM